MNLQVALHEASNKKDNQRGEIMLGMSFSLFKLHYLLIDYNASIENKALDKSTHAIHSNNNLIFYFTSHPIYYF